MWCSLAKLYYSLVRLTSNLNQTAINFVWSIWAVKYESESGMPIDVAKYYETQSIIDNILKWDIESNEAIKKFANNCCYAFY